MNTLKHPFSRQLLLAIAWLLSGLTVAAAGGAVQVGDVIRVSLPGEPALDKTFAVDRQGRIHLPEVGAINLAGLDEAAMASKVRATLATAFRDLANLDVYIHERKLLISVTGYVQQPGEVLLPAGAGIQMALRAAGGLRKGAQLDKMQLKRGSQSTAFDYKRYLDSGDTDLLPPLTSLDTLFVPASPMIGNIEVDFDQAKIADAGDAATDRAAIKVFGEVNHPGSFSHKADISLVDLLMRAGGVTRHASVDQIRVISNGEPVLFNLKRYLDSGDTGLLPAIIPGATVFVPRQDESVKSGANTVYIMGEVFKPGAYESPADASFMDILANAGGPTRFAESRQIRIIRANGQVASFDLAGFTEGMRRGIVPNVQPGDAIFVPEKTDVNEKSWLKVAPNRAVRVLGEVERPGRVEWSDEMSLMDLLAHVGGPRGGADTANIEIVTPTADGGTRAMTFDLDAFIRRGGGDSELPKIVAGSTIRVHDLPEDPTDNKSQWVRQSSDSSIYVFGQVGAPGRYRFTDDMHFLDILSAADGPTGSADLHNIRVSHRDGKTARVSRLNLALYFETGDENLLPKVRTGDTIYVPERDRSWLDQPKEQTIRVLGSVNKPGRYAFDDSMTLLDLLAEAGGPSEDAYVEKITIVNLSCCRNQARTFDLVEFSKTADFNRLPVIRAGDTVYVPNEGQSVFEKARVAMDDVFKIISIASLLGVL
ncbi:MAG: SLBB domain-containing protein [Gammaproteobacteria bacterium]|nr:SLBB domain-containing protein [Gammaproteobacteria bacterium]